MAVCWICHVETPHCHEHHVTMRARTGEEGPLVDLCGDCHTQIHTVAKARLAKQRGGKPKVANLMWHSKRAGSDIQRAEFLIGKLVEIETRMQEVEQPVAVSFRVPLELNRGLELLMQETKQSKVNTILACIQYTLRQRGLLHHESKKNVR